MSDPGLEKLIKDFIALASFDELRADIREQTAKFVAIERRMFDNEIQAERRHKEWMLAMAAMDHRINELDRRVARIEKDEDGRLEGEITGRHELAKVQAHLAKEEKTKEERQKSLASAGVKMVIAVVTAIVSFFLASKVGGKSQP